jgi:membrane-anchored glycerophosphoryl diester phosphodiesterase (GDPDase)
MPSAEDLAAQLAALDRQQSEANLDSRALDANKQAVEAINSWTQSQDRSTIAKWIACLYAGSIGGCLFYLLIRGLIYNEDVFDNMSEIIKIGVIPIVTLAFGYYFATAKSD